MKVRGFLWVIPFLALMGVFWSCENEGEIPEFIGLPEITSDTPVFSNIKVSPDKLVIKKGSSQLFKAAILGGGSGAITWTVDGTGGTTIAGNGLLMVAEDEQAQKLTVKASLAANPSRVYGTAVVFVVENDLSLMGNGITVSPSAFALGPGESRALTAKLSYTEGVEGSEELGEPDEDVTETVIWGTNSGDGSGFNGNVLNVDLSEEAETLTVTATLEDLSGGAVVMVLGNESAPMPINYGIWLDPLSVNVERGGSKKFKAYSGAGSHEINVSLSWDVFGGENNGTTISDNGDLTVAEGETAAHLIVRAKLSDDDDVYGTAVVWVSAGGDISIEPKDISLGRGEIIAYNAYLSKEGEETSNITGSVTWTLQGSSDGSGSGFLTGNNELTVGQYETAAALTVVATLENGRSSTTTVKVYGNSDDPIAETRGIKVSPDDIYILKGTSKGFTARNEADDSEITSGLSWDVFYGNDGAWIDTDGTLTVPETETAVYLTVRAKLSTDVYGTAIVRGGGGFSLVYAVI